MGILRVSGKDKRRTQRSLRNNGRVLEMAEGRDGLDLDGLVADIALLLGIVNVDFHVRGGGGRDGGGGGVGGGRERAVVCGVAVELDGGLGSEVGGLVAVDGSVGVDAVWGSVTGV